MKLAVTIQMDFMNSTFRWDRPIFDYTKIQRMRSHLVRNRMTQFKKINFASESLLNLGCGPFPHSEFVNADYEWRPGVQLCWDFEKSMLFPDQSLKGIFTEHCLEHLSKESCQVLLGYLSNSLHQGSWIRIVVPDAELFLKIYQQRKEGIQVTFPYEKDIQVAQDMTPMEHVNRIFRDHGHRFAYDFETMNKVLKTSGYRKVERCSFRQGNNPSLLIDQPVRAIESLYVEASP